MLDIFRAIFFHEICRFIFGIPKWRFYDRLLDEIGVFDCNFHLHNKTYVLVKQKPSRKLRKKSRQKIVKTNMNFGLPKKFIIIIHLCVIFSFRFGLIQLHVCEFQNESKHSFSVRAFHLFLYQSQSFSFV